jgi:hypothetical protein
MITVCAYGGSCPFDQRDVFVLNAVLTALRFQGRA